MTLVLTLAEGAALVGLRLGGPLNFHVGYTAWFVGTGLIIGGIGIVFPLLVRQVWIILKGVQGITWYRLVVAVVITFLFASCVGSTVWALVH